MTLKEDVSHESALPYAILSHTWGPISEEVSFEDLKIWSKTSPPPEDSPKRVGWAKLEGSCRLALDASLKHIWIDTCCIDKSNSTELQEAINSMFRWYEESIVCFAYLSDVEVDLSTLPVTPRTRNYWDNRPPGSSSMVVVVDSDQTSTSSVEEGGSKEAHRCAKDFLESRWFTRGWTLQELLAPRIFMFFDRHWSKIGSKSGGKSILKAIEGITGIDTRVLSGRVPVRRMSVASRMSWASRRQTTKKEYMAYCLMGLFNVFMPLLYGEGDNAFKRLQEEIIKATEDSTIFCWNYDLTYRGEESDKDRENLLGGTFSVLASHPRQFKHCGSLELIHDDPPSKFSLGPKSLDIHASIFEDLWVRSRVRYLIMLCWDTAIEASPRDRTASRIAVPLILSQIQFGDSPQ